MVRILILNILDIFVSIIECDAVGNQFLLSVNYQVTCWQGNYWIHFAFSVVMMVLFIIVCFIVTLTYFEHSDKDDARSDAFVIFSKIFHVLIFALTTLPEHKWILILFQFVLSVWMFANFIFFKPYIEKKNQKVKEVIWGMYVWSTLLCTVG